MRVKIISCLKPQFWYSDRVGEEFEVKDFNSNTYALVSGTIGGIEKSDCEIVKDKPMTKREKEIQSTELYLEKLKDKSITSISSMSFISPGMNQFDDEEPKIMSVDEVMNSYDTYKKGLLKMEEETKKRFQPLVYRLGKIKSGETIAILNPSKFAEELLNLIIKE